MSDKVPIRKLCKEILKVSGAHAAVLILVEENNGDTKDDFCFVGRRYYVQRLPNVMREFADSMERKKGVGKSQYPRRKK